MTTDLDDEQMTFSILRRGATDPGGPYLEEEILDMLKLDQISRKDYVFFEGLNDWRPIEDVFEIQDQINHFVDDGQDSQLADEAFAEVSKILNKGEEVYYIAVQAKCGILTKSHQFIVISSQHLYHLTKKEIGFEIEAHPWDSVTDSGFEPAREELGTFSFMVNNERQVDVFYLPLAQINRLMELTSEMRS